MREIGAFEAKNKLSMLLDLVERGEEVTITRRGRPVARLVRAGHAPDRQAMEEAVQRLRKRAETLSRPFDWDEWKSFRDEGRS
jgi:prevent-host-death family protein